MSSNHFIPLVSSSPPPMDSFPDDEDDFGDFACAGKVLDSPLDSPVKSKADIKEDKDILHVLASGARDDNLQKESNFILTEGSDLNLPFYKNEGNSFTNNHSDTKAENIRTVSFCIDPAVQEASDDEGGEDDYTLTKFTKYDNISQESVSDSGLCTSSSQWSDTSPLPVFSSDASPEEDLQLDQKKEERSNNSTPRPTGFAHCNGDLDSDEETTLRSDKKYVVKPRIEKHVNTYLDSLENTFVPPDDDLNPEYEVLPETLSIVSDGTDFNHGALISHSIEGFTPNLENLEIVCDTNELNNDEMSLKDDDSKTEFSNFSQTHIHVENDNGFQKEKLPNYSQSSDSILCVLDDNKLKPKKLFFNGELLSEQDSKEMCEACADSYDANQSIDSNDGFCQFSIVGEEEPSIEPSSSPDYVENNTENQEEEHNDFTEFSEGKEKAFDNLTVESEDEFADFESAFQQSTCRSSKKDSKSDLVEEESFADFASFEAQSDNTWSDFESSTDQQVHAVTSKKSTLQATDDFKISSQALESIKNAFPVCEKLIEETDSISPFLFGVDNVPSQQLWNLLEDLDQSLSLHFQWSGSQTFQKMLNSLNIDARNILRIACIPVFALGLGLLLEPVKVDADQSSEANISKQSEPTEEVIPPAQFDWTSSGLVNPLDPTQSGSTLLDLDFFVTSSHSNNTNSKPSKIFSLEQELLGEGGSHSNKGTTSEPTLFQPNQILEKLMSSGKTSLSAKLKTLEELSPEADAVINSLPDLSFLSARVLMFPVPSQSEL